MWFVKGKWIKYCSLAGAHFLPASLSFLWTYGNLAPYIDSYYQFSCSPDCVDGSSQWILNLYLAGACPGLFVVGPLIRRVGLKRLGVLSVILCSFSLFASAWMIKESVIGTTLLMGLLNGVSIGTTVSTALLYVNGWAPEKSATFTGTVTSMSPIVAVIQNQIVTAYVNPHNLKPDVYQGSSAYFSQPQILKRVPGAILILAGMTLGIQAVGYLMVTDPPEQHGNTEVDIETLRQEITTKHAGKLYETFTSESIDKAPSVLNQALYLRSTKGNSKEGIECTAKNNFQETTDTVPVISGDNSAHTWPNVNSTTTDNLKSHQSPIRTFCKPSEAFKSKSFWAVWFYAACTGYSVILKNSYYKQFGLLYIPDDNILTLLGSMIPLVEALFRIAFGVCLDRKILTLQDCLVLGISVNSVLFAFFFLAPQVNATVYIILILGLAVSHSKFFVLIASSVIMLFGAKHFPTLYAAVYVAPTIFAVVSALIATPIVQAVGWFWLFLTASIFSTIVLGLVVVTEFN